MKKDIVTQKQFFESFDGQRIAYIEKTAKNPKANVIILHGLKEHCLRYEEFAQFLCSSGFNVVVPDLRAHGDSCENAYAPPCSPDEEPAKYRERLRNSRGLTNHKDIFERITRDVLLIIERLDKNGLPLVVIGNSFGSFVAQKLFSVAPAEAYVFVASSYMRTREAFWAKCIALPAAVFKGKKRSVMIEKMVFGKGKNDAQGFKLCNNFYRSVLKSCFRLYGKNFGKANGSAPVLIMSGESDPIGKMGKNVTRLHNEFIKRGKNAKKCVYKGMRHDILTAIPKSQDVYDDILGFINKAVL